MTPSCSPTTLNRVWALPPGPSAPPSGSRDGQGSTSFRKSSISSRPQLFYHRGHRGAPRSVKKTPTPQPAQTHRILAFQITQSADHQITPSLLLRVPPCPLWLRFCYP